MRLCSPPTHGLVAILLFVLVASSCSGNTPWTPKEADKRAFDPNVDWGPLAVRKTFEQGGEEAGLEGGYLHLDGSCLVLVSEDGEQTWGLAFGSAQTEWVSGEGGVRTLDGPIAYPGDLVDLSGSATDQPFTYSEIDWAKPHQCSQELEYWALDAIDPI